MKIKPLADRIVIKQIEAEDTTDTGIILVGLAKEKPQIAEVLEVGSGVQHISVGDKVIYSKYAGTNVKIKDATVIIISEPDILVKIDEV